MNFPRLIAHRGCSTKAPENTLPAFKKAAELGVPGIELDAQMCGTGEIVVFHDFTLERIGGINKTVSETPLDSLREVDAGSWFSPEYKGEKIPLLSQVFEYLGDSVFYDIEIKHRLKKTREIENKIIKLIYHFSLENRCCISSFNPFSLRAVNKLDSAINTALIYAVHPEVPVYLRRGQGALMTRARILKPHILLATPGSFFFRSKLFRYSIVPWTVNDESECKKLFALGAAGVISDKAEEFLNV